MCVASHSNPFHQTIPIISKTPIASCRPTMNPLVLLTVLCCSTLVSSQNQHCKNIFILAGQSNMAGRAGIVDGGVDPNLPPQCKPNPQIQRLSAKLAWEEAREPLHQDIDFNKTCGVGPGMSFANALLAKDPSMGVIGLVPCAIGGTKISEWKKGETLYNNMIARSKAALNDGGVPRALLWFQGESDTTSLEDATSYKGKFEQFVNDVRADLQLPTLPVVQMVVASGDGKFVNEVRKCQLAEKIPGLKMVDAKGLPYGPDNLHLNVKGQVKAGQMFADAFLQIPPQ